MVANEYRYSDKKIVLLEDTPLQAKVTMMRVKDVAPLELFKYESELMRQYDHFAHSTIFSNKGSDLVLPDAVIYDIQVPWDFDDATGKFVDIRGGDLAGIRCFEYALSISEKLGKPPIPSLFYSSMKREVFTEEMNRRGFDLERDKFWFFDKPEQGKGMSDTLDRVLVA